MAARWSNLPSALDDPRVPPWHPLVFTLLVGTKNTVHKSYFVRIEEHPNVYRSYLQELEVIRSVILRAARERE